MKKNLEIQVSKIDEEQRVASGWGIVCKEDGSDYFDLHGHNISETIAEKAAYHFQKGDRTALDMHSGEPIGKILNCFPLTEERLKKFAGVENAKKTGLAVDMYVEEDESWEKFKSGERKAFSMGGWISFVEEEIKMIEKGPGTRRKKPKKRRAKTLTLGEFSAVDFPAMEGAVVETMKSLGIDSIKIKVIQGEAPESVKKAGSLVEMVTNEVDGHVHGISIYGYDGELRIYVEYANTSDGTNHSHAATRSEGGGIQFHSDAGHTHEDITAEQLAQAITSFLEAKSADSLEDEDSGAQEIEMTPEELKVAQESQMSPAHKAFYDAISDDSAKDAFLVANYESRESAVAKAEAEKAADPVSKENEALKSRVAELEAKSADAEVTAKAEALKHLPGDLDVRKFIVRRFDKVEKSGDADEEALREKAYEVLRAADNLASPLFDSIGKANDLGAGSKQEAEAKLDAAAKEIQKANPGMTLAAANVQAQDENPELTQKAMRG